MSDRQKKEGQTDGEGRGRREVEEATLKDSLETRTATFPIRQADGRGLGVGFYLYAHGTPDGAGKTGERVRRAALRLTMALAVFSRVFRAFSVLW